VNPEDTLTTAFAQAYREAESRKAEVEALALAKAEAAALEAEGLHVYDPLPYREALPAEPRMYEGTGIGALYGLPGSDHFLAELGDWRLVPRSSR
jgi:hypothetical protein